ncbi:MAG: hypothetical protein Q4B85_12585 [Lachnospiraceae bacterium]|nr:hypothetical protein [Lachnospiraceae bacterium]
MKKINMVYCDGFYRPEKEARKLHPEGYDCTFTKVEYVETFGDKLRNNLGEIVVLTILFMIVFVIVGYLAMQIIL